MAIGFVAMALVAVRLALIRLGVTAGLRASGIDRRTGAYVWTGLISQAGITLGLASVLAAEFPDWGSQLQMLLIALIAIDELVGPPLFRIGLCACGRDRGERAAAAGRGVEPGALSPQLRRSRAASRARRRPAAWRWRSMR